MKVIPCLDEINYVYFFLTYKHVELQLSGPELVGPMSKYDKKQYKVIP